ncbi:hypothetical protein FH968_00150 [Buttiauxella sp. B2]|uniref:hypothetical protein n=1 Tax=Buttiauxella sp. B2 TaxID=2587812 RepID=UPI001123DF3B|nr:hypothetical protein [Buttiauxella sp. B2]TNV22511.1 hypothetical protein FH968_00150 [Buttiauxella sp. B2]
MNNPVNDTSARPRVVAASLSSVLAWCDGDAQALPTLTGVTLCLWLTLSEEGSVHTVREGVSETTGEKLSAGRVIVLHQTGRMTEPAKVWPALAYPMAVAAHHGQPVTLLLTGGALLRRQEAWQNWLDFSTRGHPPVRRLLLLVLAGAVVLGNGWTARLARLGLGLIRKGKTWIR